MFYITKQICCSVGVPGKWHFNHKLWKKPDCQYNQSILGGDGIGSRAAGAVVIRDDGMPGDHMSIIEAARVPGGSLDGAGTPQTDIGREVNAC
jgi:myosin-crossreactive antigen